MNIKQVEGKIKEREILKNACVQKHTSMKEKKRLWKVIEDYDKEIFALCLFLKVNEYEIIKNI